ncbi:hypothetical protein VB773_14245 [Haloarculaceae archaeon H-GB2-1]|nr:hypothetical protein [Haloarculaceae archaeon H-GB1-1]MEA5408616.1 hypothetical protein [Haloarculaceae archaeon H-GB2-1]
MRRALVGLLLVLLVSPTIVAPIAAAPGDVETKSAENYTISELAERGQQIEGADPSRRWLGERGSVFVSYQQTNLVKEMGSQRPEWAVDKVVSPDKLVDTDDVKMHINRPQTAGEKKIHIVVLAWKTETREVNGTNGTTRQETYLTSVRKRTTEVRLTDAFETVEVALPDTENPQHITMYVREYPSARWTFAHDPVALADGLPFGRSWGDYLSWFVSRFFIITALGVPVAIAGAYKTLEHTHSGPGKSVMWWLIAGGLGSYLTLYFSHRKVAELLTTAPWVMGVFVVVIAYLATLELADPTEKGLFEGVVTTDAQNPLGEDIPDISEEVGDVVSFVDGGDGTIKLVKSELSYFVTLLAGAEPPTLDMSDLSTRVRYNGTAPGDEKFYAAVPDDLDDDEDPDLVYVQWPALSFGPDGLREMVEDGDGTMARWDTEKLSRAGLLGLLAGAAANVALGAVNWAILAAVVGFYAGTMRRVDGEASFDPAPVHSTAAKARAVTEKQELAVAETFEALQQKVAEADATTTEQAVDIAEAYINQLRGQVDRLLGGDAGGLPDQAGGGSVEVESGVSDD